MFRNWLRLSPCVVLVGLLAACASSSSPAAPASAIAWHTGPGWHTTAIQSFPWPDTPLLDGLACTGSGQCEAVGRYSPDGHIVPFVMTGLTSQRPALVRLSMPAGTVETYSANLACASPGYCAVVGTYEPYQAQYPSYGFTVTESGGRWAAARPVVLPAGSTGIQDLRGVACPSPGNCVAVGTALNSKFVLVPIVLTESDGTWGRAAYLSTPPDGSDLGGDLFSVSCASTGSCVAVGDYAVKSGLVSWPMAIVASGGRWLRAEKLPLPADANLNKKTGNSILFSVSCGPGGMCLAVGGYVVTAAGALRGLAITLENGRPGQIAEMPQEFRTVSCVPRFCAVSGSSGPVISYAGGRWSRLEPIQPSASVVQAASRGAGRGGVHVACLADGRCVTVSTFGGDSGPQFILVSTHN